MAHIHTEPGQHDLTASAYIIRDDGNEPVVLLHRHKKLGKFFQFGGHVELDETPWQSIIRELVEEAGYTAEQLKILQPFDRILPDSAVATQHPYPLLFLTVPYGGISDTHFHTDISFCFVVNAPPLGDPQDGESADIQKFNRSQLFDLDDTQIIENVKQACLLALDVYGGSWRLYPVTHWKY